MTAPLLGLQRAMLLCAVYCGMIAAGALLVLNQLTGYPLDRLPVVVLSAALVPVSYGAWLHLRYMRAVVAQVEPAGAPLPPPEPEPLPPDPAPEQTRLVTVLSSDPLAGPLGSYEHEGQKVLIVPRAPVQVIERVRREDLIWFVTGIEGGHSRTRWLNRRAPSGRLIDWKYHRDLIQVVSRVGAFTARKRGASGYLTMCRSEIAHRLGLPPLACGCGRSKIVDVTAQAAQGGQVGQGQSSDEAGEDGGQSSEKPRGTDGASAGIDPATEIP